jgi:uncharacterized protein YndB with AHSA1/START domain
MIDESSPGPFRLQSTPRIHPSMAMTLHIHSVRMLAVAEVTRAIRGQEEQLMVTTAQAPVASAQMLIRKPVASVFDSLLDPNITSRFWFSKGSGRLEPGVQVRWDWEMYGLSAMVDVKAVEANRRILIEWNGPDNPSSVEWRFEALDRDRTFVTVRNWGFRGSADKIVSEAINSAGGFSFLLAGLKAYLEHGIELNLIADHDPSSLVGAWASR